MPTEYELIKAVLQQIGKEEPTPQEEPVPGPGMIYSPQEMERQRFEEYTGHDPKLSMMKNLYNAWRGNKILGAPIPGANPEVGTPGDALTGALVSAVPMASLLGKSAGGGSAPKPAPASRPKPLSPLEEAVAKAAAAVPEHKPRKVRLDPNASLSGGSGGSFEAINRLKSRKFFREDPGGKLHPSTEDGSIRLPKGWRFVEILKDGTKNILD